MRPNVACSASSIAAARSILSARSAIGVRRYVRNVSAASAILASISAPVSASKVFNVSAVAGLIVAIGICQSLPETRHVDSAIMVTMSETFKVPVRYREGRRLRRPPPERAQRRRPVPDGFQAPDRPLRQDARQPHDLGRACRPRRPRRCLRNGSERWSSRASSSSIPERPLPVAAGACREPDAGGRGEQPGRFRSVCPLLGSVEEDIVACFRNGGGVPYERFPRFHAVMAEDSGRRLSPRSNPIFFRSCPAWRRAASDAMSMSAAAVAAF